MAFAYPTLSTSSSFLMISSRAAFGLPMRAIEMKRVGQQLGIGDKEDSDMRCTYQEGRPSLHIVGSARTLVMPTGSG